MLKRAFVDAAPSLKRSRAAGMGRVFPVLKRACHVTIEIDMSKRAGSGAAWRGGLAVGSKPHPYGFRIGLNKTWRSRWYAEKKYAELLHEDLALRRVLKRRLGHAGVAGIDIERAANQLKVPNILTSRPGIIIGRKGVEVDRLRDGSRSRAATRTTTRRGRSSVDPRRSRSTCRAAASACRCATTCASRSSTAVWASCR